MTTDAVWPYRAPSPQVPSTVVLAAGTACAKVSSSAQLDKIDFARRPVVWTAARPNPPSGAILAPQKPRLPSKSRCRSRDTALSLTPAFPVSIPTLAVVDYDCDHPPHHFHVRISSCRREGRAPLPRRTRPPHSSVLLTNKASRSDRPTPSRPPHRRRDLVYLPHLCPTPTTETERRPLRCVPHVPQ